MESRIWYWNSPIISVCSVTQIASFVNIIPYLQKCLTFNNNHMRIDLLLWHHLCNLVPNMIHVNGIRCLWELNLVSHNTRLEFLWYKCWISHQIITINFDLIRCLDECLSISYNHYIRPELLILDICCLVYTFNQDHYNLLHLGVLFVFITMTTRVKFITDIYLGYK